MRQQITRLTRAGAVIVVAAACSSDPSNTSKHSADTVATSTTQPPIDLVATVAKTSVYGVGIEEGVRTRLDSEIASQVIARVDAYVQAALVAPLEARPVELSELVAPGAAARLATGQPDRSVLTTEGIAGPTRVQASLAKVRLVGLSEDLGSISLVSASIDFNATLDAGGSPLTIRHVGELLLSRIATEWKIVGYEMTVTRSNGSGIASEATATVAP